MQDISGIDGLWFDDYGDPLEMPATKLDSMSNSLRILRFGVLNVKGKCEKRFEKLMFFQGKVAGLPFSISQVKELRYLNDKSLIKQLCSIYLYTRAHLLQ